MLPTIVSCRQLVSRSFLQAVLTGISEPMQLSRIEATFGAGDPTLIRAAVFTLLQHGQLQAPQLRTEQLSPLTCFQPIRSTS